MPYHKDDPSTGFSRSALFVALSLLTTGGLAGCSVDLGLDDLKFACTDDSQCGGGTVCDTAAGFCVAAGGEDPDAGKTDVPPGNADCVSYCSTVMSACPADGPFAQYPDQEACVTFCTETASLPAGVEGDTAGHSVTCRQHYATLADEGGLAAARYCAAAGPSGGDVCGTWCENYCDQAFEVCGFDEADCVNRCESQIDFTGLVGGQTGDTVQCRLAHLALVASDPGGDHCGSAGFTATGSCTGEVAAPTCEEYCELAMENCEAPFEIHTSEQACIDNCRVWSEWKAGSQADTFGNTIGCRLYYARLAENDPGRFCTPASHAGGDVCGSWCDNYCDISLKNCTEAEGGFEDLEDCMEECVLYPTDGVHEDEVGDTVQCRIHHLWVAGSDPPDTNQIHCPHGGVDGGGFCEGAPPRPDCQDYCTTVNLNCALEGPYANYLSDNECLTYCETVAGFESGTRISIEDNTIGCRLNAAIEAADDPDEWCGAASKSGGNICGGWCEVYCDLQAKNCAGEVDSFPDRETCLNECIDLPTNGQPGDYEGDTVQCRIEHLGIAGTGPPDTTVQHCPHGAINAAAPCAGPPPEPTCEEYCDTIELACGTPPVFTAQYESKEACLAYCSTWAQLPPGEFGTYSGNSIGCRLTYAALATLDTAECDNAGPTGGDVCGSLCTNYCHLAEVNCEGANALYSSSDECLTTCLSFSTAGDSGDTEGDTVFCRIYHLGVAGSDKPDSADLHCGHGAAQSTLHCTP